MIGTNTAAIGGVFLLARVTAASPLRRWRAVRLAYPILLLAWLYPEACLLRFSFLPADLDWLLLDVETSLFPQRFYATIPLSLSLHVLEVLHAAYFSYYLLLFLPIAIAIHRKESEAEPYVFRLLLCQLIHYGIFILFPATGPVPLRGDLLPGGIIFIPLMEAIFSVTSPGGGAFPSSHVAATVVAIAAGARLLPAWRPLLILWGAVITFSTVACSYHYTIDALAGLVVGVLFAMVPVGTTLQLPRDSAGGQPS